jgi:ribonuclease P protein component
MLDAAAYGRVFKKAARSRDKWFTVLCRANEGGAARPGVARLGLAISKKNCRAASGRNRIKRIIRESFRLNQTELAGLDVVVVNQPTARNGTNRQLFDSLHGHWQQCAKVRAGQES